MRAISSSKFRDMMSSFIDTIIQEHQDSRGVVADEDPEGRRAAGSTLTSENIKAVNIIV